MASSLATDFAQDVPIPHFNHYSPLSATHPLFICTQYLLCHQRLRQHTFWQCKLKPFIVTRKMRSFFFSSQCMLFLNWINLNKQVVCRYWGQNSYGATHSSDPANWQQRLSFYCGDDSTIDAFPVAFLNVFFGTGGLPSINLANVRIRSLLAFLYTHTKLNPDLQPYRQCHLSRHRAS